MPLAREGSDTIDCMLSNDAIDGNDMIEASDGKDMNEASGGTEPKDSNDGRDSIDGRDMIEAIDGSDMRDASDGSDAAEGRDCSDETDCTSGREGRETRDGIDKTEGKDSMAGSDSKDGSEAAAERVVGKLSVSGRLTPRLGASMLARYVMLTMDGRSGRDTAVPSGSTLTITAGMLAVCMLATEETGGGGTKLVPVGMLAGAAPLLKSGTLANEVVKLITCSSPRMTYTFEE